jgi:hypothetical protein
MSVVATKTKERRKVLPASGECPSCEAPQSITGSSHRCTGCNLVAPRSAFLATTGSSNMLDGLAPNRAWTLGGRVD